MSWRATEIGWILDGTSGEIQTGPFGTQLKASEYQEDGSPVINVRNIGYGDLRPDKLEYVGETKAAKLKAHELQKNDIVFGRKGAVDRHLLVAERQVGWIQGSDCIRLRLDPEAALPKFVSYALLRETHKKWILSQSGNKATMASLNHDIIRRIPISLPDLPTQQRIAGILSAYDDLIENNRRRIRLLEQAARLLYREWFVHLRFPGHETAKIVDGLPKGWERCIVEDLIVLQRGFDLPVGDRKEGDVPVYGSTGIVGYHNEPKVPAPAIITGRSGSLGQVAISDTPCWPLNTALWVRELKGIPATVGYFLLVGLELEKYNGGASVPTLDRKVVHRLPAVRPSPDVADQFDAMASKSFQIIAKLRTHNLQLTRARNLLLPRLMDGRIPA